MAFLRTKSRGDYKYYYLVQGIRDPETGKVKQKNLKYYGVEKPSDEQLEKDKLAYEKKEIDTKKDNSIQSKNKVFDINARITRGNLNSIIGTSWRNKHTHDLAKVTQVIPTVCQGKFELIDGLDLLYDGEDDLGMVRISVRTKWVNAMEHWYRVDHLSQDEQLEGFRRRIGYCKEEIATKRKQYNEYKTMPKERRDSCYTSNLRLQKNSFEWAQQDLEIAVKQMDDIIIEWAQQEIRALEGKEAAKSELPEYPRIHFATIPDKPTKRLKAKCRQQVRRDVCRDDTKIQPDVNCKNCIKVMPVALLTAVQKEYMREYWAQHITIKDASEKLRELNG